MTQYLLGLDSGLTVTKAVVFRTDGTVVAQGKCSVSRLKDVAHHVERDMGGFTFEVQLLYINSWLYQRLEAL